MLQVHHRDRHRANNGLENLALLCPNCHAEEHHLGASRLTENQNGGVLRTVRNRS
ncbi:MAG: HNH endonuclease [Candidatus Rokubacteria bacterium]|nr:HNH endonuclease [Candidatus Rokubacteria bacterium]